MTEDNQYKIYNKAFKSLKSEIKEYIALHDLLAVKYIGPKIVQKLQERYVPDNEELSQPVAAPAPKKPRGRPPKRSATDVDIEPPPVAKRRSLSAAQLPTHVPATQPAPPTLERSATGENKPFQFWYLDGHRRVLNRRDADVSWCEDGSQLLRIKIGYPVSQANHPLAAEFFGRERRGDCFVAEMREDAAEDFPQCTAFASDVPTPTKTSSLSALLAEEKLAQKRSNNSIDPSRQLPAYLQKGANTVASGSRNNTNAIASGSRTNASDMRLAAAARSYSNIFQASPASSPPASQLTASPSTSASSSPVRPRPTIARAATIAAASSSSSAPNLHRTASAPTPAPLHTRPRLSHAVPHLPAVEHPSLYAPITTFPEFTPRVFKAGTYTVQLILDHRERGKNDRDAIADGLAAKGVLVDRRALEIGDVAWVAKSIDGGDECMLDVVLERKRLDDLVQSITGATKRFHEQKFRLHQSGMSRVLYLVEEYDTRRQKQEWGPQISTALSSTQVVDGFLVKETKNLQDTIAYLTTWTEELSRSHAHKDLFVIPSNIIRRHSYLDLQKYLRVKYPERCYVTSFQDFQALNHKSAYTTVRDTWARMLLCVRGMSAEKVGAVIKQWDTPRALWEAFRAAQEAEQDGLAWEAAEEDAQAAVGASKGKGKGMKKRCAVPQARLVLQGVGGAEGGARAIGQALSTKLYEVFTSEDYQEGED
ncbi:ERCC4 domain-containing protein [Mycena venus]|uniref:Crossover junction endonuclease MUS81 n=1 Tax=Mycena venus TaxID=2733690 RepID=A0A8H6XYJ3_9AGAR|nr:ERCC4 domain-containing protein [Mycena venus]